MASKRSKAEANKTAARAAVRAKVRHTNAQVYMTEADPARTLPTSDPHDVAHNLKCADGLRPAAVRMRGRSVPTIPEGQGTPRHYPACLMMMKPDGSMCSFETGMEDHAARERWLQEEGLLPPTPTIAAGTEFAVAVMQGQIGAAATRDRLRPRMGE